jgi:hypothetical protein
MTFALCDLVVAGDEDVERLAVDLPGQRPQ